jgi:nitrite reductase (NADH) large subunit
MGCRSSLWGVPPAVQEQRTARRTDQPQPEWINVGNIADFPKDGGAAIKYGDVQIAVFNFTSRGEWYACQNMCPHKKAFVLSRGIVGTQGEIPKVTCPLHKKAFSLQTGECVSGDALSAKVFPVRIEQEQVYLLLPPKDQLDALLATRLHCITASHSAPACVSDTSLHDTATTPAMDDSPLMAAVP